MSLLRDLNTIITIIKVLASRTPRSGLQKDDVVSGESGNGVVHSRSLEGIESVGGQGSNMSNFSDADGADGDDTSESGGEHPLDAHTAPF